MIRYNKTYLINNGVGTIVFTEGNEGNVTSVYEIIGKKDSGIVNGIIQDNVLKGMFNFLNSNLNIYLKIEINKNFNNIKKITSTIELLEKCNYNFFIVKDGKFMRLSKSEIIKFLIYRNSDIFCKKSLY